MIRGAIDWFSPTVGSNCGYGYAANELIAGLNRQRLRVDYDSGRHPVHISWVQPDWYSGSKNQFRIGFTPWESTEIPDSWIGRMNEMDEIWTNSQFFVDVFERSGIEVPVRNVPLGINPDHYYPVERNLDGKFVFLHIGGPTERKGGQLAFDAFQELFEGNENVVMIVKSMGPSEIRYYDKNGGFHPVFEHPQVQAIDYEVSEEGLMRLYAMSDCLLYPSNGEGFGFIPFQGIATGLPTIVTNGTALADFAHLSVPLNWKWTEGEGIHIGKWCEPDKNDLKEKMLHVYNNWQAEHEKALRGAEWIRNNQTWDNIAELIFSLIEHKL